MRGLLPIIGLEEINHREEKMKNNTFTLNCCACGGLEYLLFLLVYPIYKWIKKRRDAHKEDCACDCHGHGDEDGK